MDINQAPSFAPQRAHKHLFSSFASRNNGLFWKDFAQIFGTSAFSIITPKRLSWQFRKIIIPASSALYFPKEKLQCNAKILNDCSQHQHMWKKARLLLWPCSPESLSTQSIATSVRKISLKKDTYRRTAASLTTRSLSAFIHCFPSQKGIAWLAGLQCIAPAGLGRSFWVLGRRGQ